MSCILRIMIHISYIDNDNENWGTKMGQIVLLKVDLHWFHMKRLNP